MLATVLLHIIKPVLPINLTFHGLTLGKRRTNHMSNYVSLNLYIKNLCTAKHTFIRSLTSLLREEAGSVQDKFPGLQGILLFLIQK